MSKYIERKLLTGCSVIHVVNDGSEVVIAALLPLIAKEFVLSYFQIGLLLAAYLVILGGFQIVFGYLSEKFSEKALLSIGLGIVMISSFLISQSRTFSELLFFNCMAGVGASTFHPANFTLVSRIYEGNVHRDKVMGVIAGVGDLGVLIAFFSNGFVGQFFGWRLAFLIWGILAALAIIIHTILSRSSSYSCLTTNSSEHSSEMQSDGSHSYSSKVKWGLVVILILNFCVGASYRTFLAFTPLFLTTTKGLNTAAADSLMSIMIAVGVISISLSGFVFNKYEKRQIELLTLLLLGIVSILFAFVQSIGALILLLLMVGVSLYIMYPIILTLIADLTHFEKRGRSYGIFMSISWIGGAFSSFINGVLSEIFGLFIIYIIVAIIMLFCIGLVSLSSAELWSKKTIESGNQ
ncbi:MAG: MFS transporter [Promethearchaeota archaeon]